MTKRIMVQGTMSGAGKSLLTAALCRIFAQEGLRVAPFKSQNMALNSYVTRDGLEMGRAQAVQAFAAGCDPDVRMNPILLKPSSDVGSQLIVMGEVLDEYEAYVYYQMKQGLVPEILAAYESLAAENDVIVIEGAGSPAEINLKDGDFVNMGLATMVDAPVILVGDIDRGGVFAQLLGTVDLLEPDERVRIVGYVINKFRGDVEILKPGLEELTEKTGLPVLGVLPYIPVDLDDEDSLAERLNVRTHAEKPLDVAIIRFPRISNFTDFAPLERHPAIGVRYVDEAAQLGDPDLIILPGTKDTMGDLLWMRSCGLEAKVIRCARSGASVVLGICGGYQMLGKLLRDPDGVEHGGELKGMGLLPVTTIFDREKVRTRVTGRISSAIPELAGTALEGYEIHMGRSVVDGAQPFCHVRPENGCSKPDGTVFRNVCGTYVHGLFDTAETVERFTSWLLTRKGLGPAEVLENLPPLDDHRIYLDKQIDEVADMVREHLDLDVIRRAMDEYESHVPKPVPGPATVQAALSQPTYPQPIHTRPADIERTSMATIDAELAAHGIVLWAEHEAVVKRVIHTTADLDYAENLVFTLGAVSHAVEALTAGCTVVTDTTMALAGISKPGLAKLGCQAFCFVGDADIAEQARLNGTTRAVAAIDRAVQVYGDGAIFAVGNAPTALLALADHIEQGLHPALVIGVPVGFVNVVEAKERMLKICERLGVPAIIARGRKGGSNVAAAVCNALIYEATDTLDPTSRTW